jgi:hypothetical protein
MPDRELIKAEGLRMAGFILHNLEFTKPEEFPIQFRGWLKELRQVAVEKFGADRAGELFAEQLRDIRSSS